jgi:hypothetical protein
MHIPWYELAHKITEVDDNVMLATTANRSLYGVDASRSWISLCSCLLDDF